MIGCGNFFQECKKIDFSPTFEFSYKYNYLSNEAPHPRLGLCSIMFVIYNQSHRGSRPVSRSLEIHYLICFTLQILFVAPYFNHNEGSYHSFIVAFKFQIFFCRIFLFNLQFIDVSCLKKIHSFQTNTYLVRGEKIRKKKRKHE